MLLNRHNQVQKQYHRHFIAAWLRSPLKMGAVLPSSRKLAQAIARQVDIGKEGAVVEIGAGTGVVTKALLGVGVSKNNLLVIEREKQFYNLLERDFPELRLLCADAMNLEAVLQKSDVSKVNAIVSSLPLLSMPSSVRLVIEEQMAKAIGDGGIIIQFTYGHRSPISGSELERYRLKGKRVKTVVANIPPAHIWIYERL